MDPLLLTGAVRVALGQLSDSTEVRLRVLQTNSTLWTDAIALLPNLALKPTVEAGEGMRLGDCVIETSLGSVDLGIRSQLAEIERGFFDRAGSGRSSTGSDPLSDHRPESAVSSGGAPLTTLLAATSPCSSALAPGAGGARFSSPSGQTIESAGPLASVGECCEIRDQFGDRHLAEVIGFKGSNVLSMPVETTEGIRFGDSVAALGIHPEIEVGPALDGSRPQCPGRSYR